MDKYFDILFCKSSIVPENSFLFRLVRKGGRKVTILNVTFLVDIEEYISLAKSLLNPAALGTSQPIAGCVLLDLHKL